MDILTPTLAAAVDVTPAIAGSPLSTLSARYVHVDTRDVIAICERAGWSLTATQDLGKRREVTSGRHGVRLTYRGKIDGCDPSMHAPQLVLRNSHDGSTALVIRAGLYTFACANQAVVGTTLASVHLRHVGFSISALHDALHQMLLSFPRVFETLQQWRDIELKGEALVRYLQAAIALRERAYRPDVDGYANFAVPRRDADRPPTLESAYQRAQESLIRGGYRYQRWADDVGPQVRLRGPIKALARSTDINSRLWDLTVEAARAQ